MVDDEFDITKLFEVIEKRDKKQKRSNPSRRESDSLLLSSSASINSLFGDDVAIDLPETSSNNNNEFKQQEIRSGSRLATSSSSQEKGELTPAEELESLIRNAFVEEKGKFMEEMRALETAFTQRMETRLLSIVKKKQ